MAAITICSDFGAQINKVSHCFHCFPIYLPWSDRTRCHFVLAHPYFQDYPQDRERERKKERNEGRSEREVRNGGRERCHAEYLTASPHWHVLISHWPRATLGLESRPGCFPDFQTHPLNLFQLFLVVLSLSCIFSFFNGPLNQLCILSSSPRNCSSVKDLHSSQLYPSVHGGDLELSAAFQPHSTHAQALCLRLLLSLKK